MVGWAKKGVLLQVPRANGANGSLPRGKYFLGPGKSSRTVATSSPVLSFIWEKKVLGELWGEEEGTELGER